MVGKSLIWTRCTDVFCDVGGWDLNPRPNLGASALSRLNRNLHSTTNKDNRTPTPSFLSSNQKPYESKRSTRKQVVQQPQPQQKPQDKTKPKQKTSIRNNPSEVVVLSKLSLLLTKKHTKQKVRRVGFEPTKAFARGS